MSWVLKQVFPVNQFDRYALYGPDLFVANYDFAIRHWNTQTHAIISVLKGHRGKITDLQYSSEWQALFSTSIDGYLMIWNGGHLVAQFLNKERRSDPFGVPLHSCTFNPRKDQLIVGAVGEIFVFQITWDLIQNSQDGVHVQTIKPMLRMNLHKDIIHKSMCCGDKLITASHDRTIGYSRLDSLSVNKILPLKERQAICNYAYDSPNETVYVGSIDGRIHAITRDGLVLQSDSIGYDCGVVSIAIDHSIGLLWVVMASGEMRLLDIHNFTTDLTDFFDTLRERPIFGVDTYRFFAVHYDSKLQSMFAFCNDHYVFEFKFDESAAQVTFYAQSPMHCMKLVDHQILAPVLSIPNESFSSMPLVHTEQMKEGLYIAGGDKTINLYIQQSRFQYQLVNSIPAKSHATCIDFTDKFCAFGDDLGNVSLIRLSDLKSAHSIVPVKGSITSIHLTELHIIVTTSSGNWDIFPVNMFPEPLEELIGREMAHNNAINDSKYDASDQTLLTAGADGMLKLWRLMDRIPLKAKRYASTSLFLTSGTTMSETNVVDMRKFGEVRLVQWAHTADKWITAHSDSQIRVWSTDILNISLLLTIPCGHCHITALNIDDPGQVVAAVDDKTIRTFSLETGELLRTLIGHKDLICNIGIHPKIPFYVTTSWDGAVKVWSKLNITTRKRATPLLDMNSPRKRTRPKTSFVSKPKKATPLIQPLSIYEKRKQEIEKRRMREKAEFEAKLRSPFAKELKLMAKTLLEHM